MDLAEVCKLTCADGAMEGGCPRHACHSIDVELAIWEHRDFVHGQLVDLRRDRACKWMHAISLLATSKLWKQVACSVSDSFYQLRSTMWASTVFLL